MPKLTVQFLIDGNQIDEVEVEEPNEADLRQFITVLKEGLNDLVTDLHCDEHDDWTKFCEQFGEGPSEKK